MIATTAAAPNQVGRERERSEPQHPAIKEERRGTRTTRRSHEHRHLEQRRRALQRSSRTPSLLMKRISGPADRVIDSNTSTSRSQGDG
jgi:hypothetical protein